MAILRGEVMDAFRLVSYSMALAEEFARDDDTLWVLRSLARSARAEFEAKIPELGNLLQMIRRRRSERLEKAEQEDRRREYEAFMRDVREHPENYVTMEEVWAEVERRMTARSVPNAAIEA